MLCLGVGAVLVIDACGDALRSRTAKIRLQDAVEHPAFDEHLACGANDPRRDGPDAGRRSFRLRCQPRLGKRVHVAADTRAQQGSQVDRPPFSDLALVEDRHRDVEPVVQQAPETRSCR